MREILVVPTSKIFKQFSFKGFLNFKERDFVSLILENYEYSERNDSLENNPDYKQIVTYVWLVNKENKKVFLYQREKGSGSYKEKRLLNKWSGGIGGHIDKETEENEKNPIEAAMNRELREEIQMDIYPKPFYFGYLYEEQSMIEKVHFGVVGIAETNLEAKPADGMKQGEFYSVDEADEMMKNPENDFENWTKMSWPFVRDYINSLM